MEQVRIVDRVIARRKGEATDAPGDLPFGGLTAKSPRPPRRWSHRRKKNTRNHRASRAKSRLCRRGLATPMSTGQVEMSTISTTNFTRVEWDAHVVDYQVHYQEHPRGLSFGPLRARFGRVVLRVAPLIVNSLVHKLARGFDPTPFGRVPPLGGWDDVIPERGAHLAKRRLQHWPHPVRGDAHQRKPAQKPQSLRIKHPECIVPFLGH
eukprot:7380512-Prymnesium_polylepis.7